MKKVIFAIALTLLTFSAKSQESKNDFTVSYGVLTNNHLLDFSSDLLSYALTGSNYSTNNTRYTGAILASYSRYLNNHFSTGITIGYDNIEKDAFLNSNKVGTVKTNYLLVGVEGNYRYFKKGSFQLYSGLGIGYTFGDEKYTPLTGSTQSDKLERFDFNINAIGLRVGRVLAFKGELGFGYKGIANIGVSYQF